MCSFSPPFPVVAVARGGGGGGGGPVVTAAVDVVNVVKNCKKQTTQHKTTNQTNKNIQNRQVLFSFLRLALTVLRASS